MVVYHVASEPIGPRQVCARCGVVLVDYTGAMIAGPDTRPRFWPAQRIIAQDGGAWVLEAPGALNSAIVQTRLCMLT